MSILGQKTLNYILKILFGFQRLIQNYYNLFHSSRKTNIQRYFFLPQNVFQKTTYQLSIIWNKIIIDPRTTRDAKWKRWLSGAVMELLSVKSRLLPVGVSTGLHLHTRQLLVTFKQRLQSPPSDKHFFLCTQHFLST